MAYPSKHVVLLVEDEDFIRTIALTALEDADCTVYEFASADAAISRLTTDSSSAHVVFTDINLPGNVDGFALAHRVSTDWPHLGILVTSAIPPTGRLPLGARFVSKPYNLDEIVRHIHELALPG